MGSRYNSGAVTRWTGQWADGEFSQPKPGNDSDLLRRYEPLWNEYGVDLLLFGHVHAYERTYPVVNYAADPTGCAPTYITIGERSPLQHPDVKHAGLLRVAPSPATSIYAACQPA